MPELPEVETIRRGLAGRLVGATIEAAGVRETRLRWPVDEAALGKIVGGRVDSVRRVAKYLLLDTDLRMTLVLHLGMSGRLLLADPRSSARRHEHVWWSLDGGNSQGAQLRFRDPRRFGAVLVVPSDEVATHRLFRHLGPDPMGERFTVDHLRSRSRGSRRPVKNLLMDSRVVSGIGNIYASEALWLARVNPKVAAGRIGPTRWKRVRDACVEVLQAAIRAGGTTLNDFRDSEGNLGYFAVQLRVYGREREPCARCDAGLRRVVQAGRSTFYCARCQH